MTGSMLRAGLAAILTATLAIGCGPSSDVPRSLEQLSIGQVGQIFHSFQKAKKPAPKEFAEIQPLLARFPAAVESIRSGDVLVFWGAGIDEGPDAPSTVLAYQKDVPEKGGEVLMQDGTPRRMTPEEFRDAKKPAGASTELKLPARGKKKK